VGPDKPIFGGKPINRRLDSETPHARLIEPTEGDQAVNIIKAV